MRQAMFMKAGLVEVADRDQPTIEKEDDVIIRVVKASVCGSDLWGYRGESDQADHSVNSGHEAIGIVAATGSAINTVKKGDFVIAPFVHGCGHCAACLAGFDSSCQSHTDNFSSGFQGEYIRFQHGNWSLIKVPGQPSDYTEGMLNSFLTLADVMPTGYHAARTANVQKGDTAVVIGDGAVGLCAVIAAKMRGAKQIIVMSRHEDRQKLALEFGATDIVAERGDEGVQAVMALTHGVGADAVMECVGNEQAIETAVALGRPGSTIGRVGLPHGKGIDMAQTFYRNIFVGGGPAAVTTYDKGFLLQAVLDGQINPGKVFTSQYSLDDINAAYQAMDQRQTIKAAINMPAV